MSVYPLRTILKHFPPVCHAFAYGSGVMHQPGLYEQTQASTSGRSQNSSPMVDLIFAVKDAHAWHSKVTHAWVDLFTSTFMQPLLFGLLARSSLLNHYHMATFCFYRILISTRIIILGWQDPDTEVTRSVG